MPPTVDPRAAARAGLLDPPARACSASRCCWSSCSRASSAARRDGKDATATATQAGATVTDAPTHRRPAPTADGDRQPAKGKKRQEEDSETARPSRSLAEPTGACAELRHRRHARRRRRPPGGADVPITLNLRTIAAAGLHLARCRRDDADRHDHLRRRPRSGQPRVPGERSRPGRRGPPGRRPPSRRRSGRTPSAPTRTAPTRTDWALPGFYHVEAAALGGEPTDVQFELVDPDRGRDHQDGRRPSRSPRPRARTNKSKQDDTDAAPPGEQGEPAKLRRG